MNRCLRAGVAILLLLTGGGLASAETFPSRPVHILVPYAAGGAVDIIARTLGDVLAKTWGQQPVIDNRPGAGGIIASQALVQSAPDGYTLILVASGHPLNQFFYSKLPYDTFKDFTPITEVGYSPLAVVVDSKTSTRDLSALLADMRQKPDAFSYATSGIGTSAHLAGELLKHMAKVQMTMVPYRGGAPAVTAVLSGDVPLAINPLAEILSQVEGKNLRALAVTTKTRSSVLPDVPTVTEQGVPGYDAAVWWGFLGPKGMPADLVDRLNRDLIAALRTPSVVERLKSLGAEPVGSSPAEFDAYMRAEAERWEPILKDANIKMQ
ncbi:tripartite tricarboxylate transporter substrate binding protein [Bradyrhizobium prioriisuperbiae]|uniref:Bug family tripartite tricarboxylate transporter substrate binding protein n=1 Tax=Bradyrhizobium prioriisuperbiae TaxID=2854389 RepID=UPI0028E344E5|nr:tripartite tricarboxylate transporter substrate binding protein [Bradyrhizobium prioritasuperba]